MKTTLTFSIIILSFLASCKKDCEGDLGGYHPATTTSTAGTGDTAAVSHPSLAR